MMFCRLLVRPTTICRRSLASSTDLPQSLIAAATSEAFTQKPFQLHNAFTQDIQLRNWLQRESKRLNVPSADVEATWNDLDAFGRRIVDELHDVHLRCERQPPQHVPFDAWGNRIDHLVTGEAWQLMRRVSAEEGLIGLAYPQAQSGEEKTAWSRIHQMAKLFLFSPHSGLYSCPLAMTDGAARILAGPNASKCALGFKCHLNLS